MKFNIGDIVRFKEPYKFENPEELLTSTFTIEACDLVIFGELYTITLNNKIYYHVDGGELEHADDYILKELWKE